MSVSADLATLAEWRNVLREMGEVYEGMRLCAHGVIDGGGVAGKGWRDAAFWRNAEDVQAKAEALAGSRGERPFPVFDGFRDALGQFKIFMGKAESIEATPPSPSGPYSPEEQRTRRKAAIVREAIDLAERWAAARGELWGAIPFLEQGQAFLSRAAGMVADERECLAWIRAGVAGIGRGVEDVKAAVQGKTEVGAVAGDLVATFRDFDAALKGEAGTQLDIAAGVLADAKEEGRLIGRGGVRPFVKWWRGWVKKGRPDAAQYAEIHEREGRWPV